MKDIITALLLLTATCWSLTTTASPHHKRNGPSDVHYDQSQAGETNVRADLDNFLILVVPPSMNGMGLGFLDILKKGMKHKLAHKHGDRSKVNRNNLVKTPGISGIGTQFQLPLFMSSQPSYDSVLDDVDQYASNEVDPDVFSQRFLEAKSNESPYSIDLTARRQSLLQRLYPNIPPNIPVSHPVEGKEVVIAESPTVYFGAPKREDRKDSVISAIKNKGDKGNVINQINLIDDKNSVKTEKPEASTPSAIVHFTEESDDATTMLMEKIQSNLDKITENNKKIIESGPVAQTEAPEPMDESSTTMKIPLIERIKEAVNDKLVETLKTSMGVISDRLTFKDDTKRVQEPKKILLGIDINRHPNDERTSVDKHAEIKPEQVNKTEESNVSSSAATKTHEFISTVTPEIHESTTKFDKYKDKDVKIEIFPNGTLELTMFDKKQPRGSGEELELLGALEQCGPDRVRDVNGVCQNVNKV